ncbi:conjugative relaxase TrwC/TraI family protein [Nocardioides sp.]|uniref:TraA-like transfer protein n=1 Tax=metagenome TaxID=256318 RepID=A0A2P2BXC5_9ZZZZ
MTVAMRVMSAGKGYQYLLRSVAAGDGNRSLSTPLTRYYAEAGTPPGRWMGTGVLAFGNGQITPGAEVTESQLALLLGMGRDPITGDNLGKAYAQYKSVQDRIGERVAELEPTLSAEEREAQVTKIEAEESESGGRTAVAGYDFTFSVPKSVSVLWGVADAGTQAMIVEAHHAAVEHVVDFIEREVAATRRGTATGDGAVAQVDVLGIAATAYDHWDSRAGDPQLHTHVVISNKVKTLGDGKWRALDGRPMHAAVVALSEHYNAVLADRLTGTFGLGWERRLRAEDRNPLWEITGVSDDLIAEFSSRTRAIEIEKERLITEYVDRYGRRPSRATVIRLRSQATLATRPEKQVRSLADLTADWRQRAGRLLGADPTEWAGGLTTGTVPSVLQAGHIPIDLMAEVGAVVVARVSEKRSTWRHWNLWAEAVRQTMGWRFATVEDREAVTAIIVEAAERESLTLTPPELATCPMTFRRSDGTSCFRPKHSTVYSSADILAAEDRLLARAEDRDASTVELAAVEHGATRQAERQALSREQVTALESIVGSGRQIDLLVGPAGAGKTTAMRALLCAWTGEYGKGSVVGLAPSAAAAQVLGGDLGVACDNTAKWLHEHDRGNVAFRRNQLVIIDEATLAGTRTLDRLTGLAAEASAKVLLVGDWAQLQSVDAGGAFAMLAEARDDVPELAEIHRFTHQWEKAASLDLRHGRVEAIGTYARHHRLRDGNTEEMIDAAYAAWRADTRAGLKSVLVAEAAQAVHDLNARARAERLLDGNTDPGREAHLADSTSASVGDLVITRRNDRRLRSVRGGWVRNGDRWIVIDVRTDGSIAVRRQSHRWAAAVVLPPEYVAKNVDLGYAVTAHRAQGLTVDTAHVVVSGSTTRENLYVSMTRGRDSNIAYVALDKPDDSHAAPNPEDTTASTVLYGVLQHSGAELSAHQIIEAEQERWSSIAQLAAEYETIAGKAQHDRWATLIRGSGLTPDQAESVIESDSFGPLTAELRRAEAYHHQVEAVLPKLVASRPLDDAQDIGAVLRSRLRHATTQPRRGRNRPEPRLIAGLIPIASGAMGDELRTALTERHQLIEARATALAAEAIRKAEPWIRSLGELPTDPNVRDRWTGTLRAVAAYRDRYGIDAQTPLGPVPATDTQRHEAALAKLAIRRAEAMSRQASEGDARCPAANIEGAAIR